MGLKDAELILQLSVYEETPLADIGIQPERRGKILNIW